MNDVNVYRGTPEELPDQWRKRAERKRLCGLLSEAALDEAHANELEAALALQPARGDGAVAWPEWMRDREQVEGLLAHLEGIGWRPDSKGDPECHDQGAAMSADVIRHVLLPMLASTSAAVGGRVGEEAWTGEVDCCDAKGMWLVMADDCPLVPGQKVRVSLDTITKEQSMATENQEKRP